MGYDWGMPIVRIWGGSFKTDKRSIWKRMKNWYAWEQIANIKPISAFNMMDSDMENYIIYLEKIGPFILRGYADSIFRLAEYCRRNNINTISPVAVTTTSEMLTVPRREIIKEQFKCPVFDQYACAEVLGVATECEEHVGLHIASEHCIVEIVDDEGKPLPPGEKGHIILTDLDNFAMPFIRYKVGDIGRLISTPCKCGRNLPLMDFVTGRATDMIFPPNGNALEEGFFTHIMEDLGWYADLNIKNFQIVQVSENILHWTFVSGRMPETDEKNKMISLANQYLGDMEHMFFQVDSIPKTSSGKHRYIRSEVGEFSARSKTIK